SRWEDALAAAVVETNDMVNAEPVDKIRIVRSITRKYIDSFVRVIVSNSAPNHAVRDAINDSKEKLRYDAHNTMLMATLYKGKSLSFEYGVLNDIVDCLLHLLDAFEVRVYRIVCAHITLAYGALDLVAPDVVNA